MNSCMCGATALMNSCMCAATDQTCSNMIITLAAPPLPPAFTPPAANHFSMPPLKTFSTPQVLRNAKLWCDTESAAEAAELSAALGTTIVPSFTATKLLWLKRHEPQLFEQLAHVLLPHDYFNWFLTGKYAMEVGGWWWCMVS